MRPTHVLFDFFGTLVEYSASRTEQGYPGSHALLRRLGAGLSYPDYLVAFSTTMAGFDERGAADDREYSMAEAGGAFLTEILGNRPGPAEVDAFVATYIREWNTGVRYPPAVAGVVHELARDHRLAVVTNTHLATLVPDHLSAMGLRSAFDAVITSVEVGWRKPDPRIYAAALATLGIDADAAVFVGDSYRPDFVGPERAGIRAFLIDPDGHEPVPVERRLSSIVDFPDRLRSADPGRIGVERDPEAGRPEPGVDPGQLGRTVREVVVDPPRQQAE